MVKVCLNEGGSHISHMRVFPGENWFDEALQVHNAATKKQDIMALVVICATGDGFLLTVKGNLFMLDNASIHTAQLVKDWFIQEGIEVIDWRAQSSDLNIIENV